jgi:nicotinamidase-related amidase
MVVLGVRAEGCVRATVKGAISRGFAVVVVSDAIASSHNLFRRFRIWSIKNAGAIIKESSEVLNPSESTP